MEQRYETLETHRCVGGNMRIGDLVRKHTSIKGFYNYGIVTMVDIDVVKVSWFNSNPKNPWIAKGHLEVIV